MLSDFTINDIWIWIITMIEFQLVFTIISQPQQPQTTYKHFRENTKAFFKFKFVKKRAFLMAKIRVCVYACTVSISLFYVYSVILTIILLPYLQNGFETLYSESKISLMQPSLFGFNFVFSVYSVIDNVLNFKLYLPSVLFCNVILFFSGSLNFVAMFRVNVYVVALFHLLIFVSFICILFGAFFGWFYNYDLTKKKKKKFGKKMKHEKHNIWTRASATVIGATGVGKTRFLRALISEKLRKFKKIRKYVFLFFF